ncbi:GNAT family N-acetyltransferase [Paenibacillus physcomitrellae]|uniref:N-acetyltransferase YbbJ n=1 Tax=Paenibacillus physcomitrellae TaxID=1619311 RepID=A0ABQ1FPP8_9BACL|nr:GNAT family N-acetyltransferase [Paenibacillus physcomitrellae]GGA24283.1 putative N-acetyltransferase YbbJ [Paenibacillus physcomitrellae]
MIELQLYRHGFFEDLMKFELPQEQQAFTAMPLEVLELALQDENRYPVVIVIEAEAVGFFVLHLHSELAEQLGRPKAVLLRALSMNHKHQGQGYAKQAMLKLPELVKQLFPDQEEIVLAVNEKNEAGRQLYSRCGFEDLGHRNTGRSGLQLVLHYRL